jgi:hypothetical protein
MQLSLHSRSKNERDTPLCRPAADFYPYGYNDLGGLLDANVLHRKGLECCQSPAPQPLMPAA